jgi:putative spermidine/putrescine transport system ATP-binding protein
MVAVQNNALYSDHGQAQGETDSLYLRAVSKLYGDVAAVDRVDLSIARGEFITLLGPSGSGKTTLLMMIAGFVTPTTGEISLSGRPITHLPPERRNVGMVFQGYALFPHLSVAGNVAFPLRVRRLSKADIASRVDGALELVQLRNLAERFPRQLSGGQQQRVALARALVFTPDLLLLDEPLSALDKGLRAGLQWELKQLHRKLGKTFVYVTHDQEEALSMSDRVAILRDGRLVQVGPPTDLYEFPATRFVADFLGKSNFIKGVVERQTGNLIHYQTGGRVFVQDGTRRRVGNGESLLLALRPEKIVASVAPPVNAANALAGEIVSLSYVGSNFHFRVRTEQVGEMLVTAATWRSEVAPQPGKNIWLSWDAEASVIVDED